jgi:hypothetical protein
VADSFLTRAVTLSNTCTTAAVLLLGRSIGVMMAGEGAGAVVVGFGDAADSAAVIVADFDLAADPADAAFAG